MKQQLEEARRDMRIEKQNVLQKAEWLEEEIARFKRHIFEANDLPGAHRLYREAVRDVMGRVQRLAEAAMLHAGIAQKVKTLEDTLEGPRGEEEA